MEFAELNFDTVITNGETPAHEVINEYYQLFDNPLPLVICVGDSFSHGHGAADYLIHGYPGDQSQDEFKHITQDERIKWSNLKSSLIQSDFDQKRIWTQERKNSWPNQLQQIRPDVQVLNLSIPGGSVERAVRLLNEWSLVVKRIFPNRKITLVCGNSFHWRHELLSINGYAMCVPGLTPDRSMKVEQLLHDLCLNHWDEKIHTHFYFKEVSWLISISKINNFDIHFVGYYTDNQIERGEIFKRYASIIEDIWPGMPMVKEGEYKSDEKIYSYDGHYNAMVYKNVAKKISCLI